MDKIERSHSSDRLEFRPKQSFIVEEPLSAHHGERTFNTLAKQSLSKIPTIGENDKNCNQDNEAPLKFLDER